jgi:predicted SAM-dependent methyltransferase
MSDAIDTAQKRTYNDTLDRLGFFCQVCGSEVRNEHGLVHFHAAETAQSLNVCHECLPEWFE